jgi:UDPglucose--hexose-1-phosphate uridylyltransferase
MNLDDRSHRRRNLLSGEWVLVSPQRMERPWQGQVDAPEAEGGPTYDPGCYLCPGNARAGGRRNPDYRGSFAFDNDFPALTAPAADEGPSVPERGKGLFVAEPEHGHCRVVCFSERHDLRLAVMDDDGVAAALQALFHEFAELDRRPGIGYVQVFENRGLMMGCSNPHPHAQVWATQGLPTEPARELERQKAWYREQGSPLLLDYLQAELATGERLVCANEHAVSLVPFWATWPYEALLMPRQAAAGPGDMTAAAVLGLARVLRCTLRACERLFDASVPYTLGFHPRPSDGAPHAEWQFHAHLYPPLLRSATVRKHMVGFEMLGMPQRDLTPEAAACRLRNALEGDSS